MSDFDPAVQPIEETYGFGVWKGLGLGLYTGFLLTTVSALIVFAVFLLIQVAGLIGGLVPIPAQLAEIGLWLMGVALFFLFSWAFLGIVGIPFGVFATLLALRRTIRVKDRVMTFAAGLRRVEIPLSECYWQVSSMCLDTYTTVSLRRPSIIVRKMANERIHCGFTLDSFRFWHSYLSLAVGPATPKHNWLKNWKSAPFSVICGTVIGWLVGSSLQVITGHPDWTTAGTFLGIVDGLFSGGFVLFKGHPKAKQQGVNLHPTILSVTFAALGVKKIGAMAGIPGMVICFLGNGFIGWFLGKHVQCQIAADAAPGENLSSRHQPR